MKSCRKCKESKTLDSFFKDVSEKDGLNTMCRECWKAIRRERYEKRKDKDIAKTAAYKKAMRLYLTEYKVSRGCQRCGENHPAVLDLHHLDADDKEIAPSRMVDKGWSKEKMQSELDKCIVLCSNCHRKEHYQPY